MSGSQPTIRHAFNKKPRMAGLFLRLGYCAAGSLAGFSLSVAGVAGASTWARLLGLAEVFTFEAVVQAASSGVPVVLVCRSTESSVAACFDAIAASRGQVRIAAVVVVPDAPGAVIRSVQHRLKILGSSHRLVQVPWVKDLRAVGLDRITDEIRLSKPVARAVSKVSTALELGAVGKEKV